LIIPELAFGEKVFFDKKFGGIVTAVYHDGTFDVEITKVGMPEIAWILRKEPRDYRPVRDCFRRLKISITKPFQVARMIWGSIFIKASNDGLQLTRKMQILIDVRKIQFRPASMKLNPNPDRDCELLSPETSQVFWELVMKVPIFQRLGVNGKDR
jgi:hypothetical protein